MSVPNTHDPLSQSLGALGVVDEKKSHLLKIECHVNTAEELLLQFPFRYEDRSKFYTIASLHADLNYVQLRGSIDRLTVKRGRRKPFLSAYLYDTSAAIELLWYNRVAWWQRTIKRNTTYIVYGRLSVYKNKKSIVHPEIQEVKEKERLPAFLPVYHSSAKLTKGGLDSRGLMEAQKKVLEKVIPHIEEMLPVEVVEDKKLMSRRDAFMSIHFPESRTVVAEAKKRMHFENLFLYQLAMLSLKVARKKNTKGVVFDGQKLAKKFREEVLPFTLTGSQERVVREIYEDMKHGYQMNRLLQGDVGAGKTIVAFLCMLAVIEAKAQVACMVPTEVLADQHLYNLSDYAQPLGIQIAKLSGSTTKKERVQLHEDLLSGKTHVLIGTHALLEAPVQFKNLGLVVIDEQHRFGVGQRARLWEKKRKILPHVLVMTATPIPRTLAMTRYGNLDVSLIDELPTGRKPIKTVHRYYQSSTQGSLSFSKERAAGKIYDFIHSEIKKGRQAYIIYPIIEESETLSLRHLQEGHREVSALFSNFRVDMLHGKLPPHEKQRIMRDFTEKKSHVLVSTTVVEVGVDVANATIMLIEHADRFGLAQLHQLRGRIGRGQHESYCILMTDEACSEDAKKRIQTITKTTDGFVIAEADMKIRGHGNIMGTEQSGLPEKQFFALFEDETLVNASLQSAKETLREDPELQQNPSLQKRVKNAFIKWSRIS